MNRRLQGFAWQGVRRLVVVCPSWVGDTVMATPVLRALGSHLSDTTIIALCQPGIDELLAGFEGIGEVRTAPAHGMRGLLGAVGVIRGLGADAALLLPNSFRSALMARAAGVARRIGYARDGRGWLLTHALRPPPRGAPISAVEYYAQLGEWAMGGVAIERRLTLGLTPAQREAGRALLSDVPGPFVLLSPGANRLDKRWPIERFAAVAEALAKSHGLAAAACGSPVEAPIVDELAARSATPIVNLARRGLSLGSLKAIVEACALLITNDTGPRHVAAALGRPAVALFGPTDHRWTTLPRPRGAPQRIVLADPFLPEEEVADRHAHRCAMDKIATADVLAAARQLLDKPAAALS